MSHKPTISVTGVGKVSVPPDMTVITFQMSALDRVYQDSVEMLNDRVASLRQALQAVDVEPRDLKTTSFEVGADHDWDGKRNVFKGWKAEHDLRLELPVDRDTLNRVLGAITSADIHSKLQVRFEVRDKATLRTQVLADATKSARRNADAIASAAGCTLGEVMSMNYGWSEVRFESVRYAMDSMMESDALSAPDIEPENVDASDSVTVVWELVEG